MGLVKILQHIVNHPLNREHKAAAVARFARWQIAGRLLGSPVAIEFVNGSSLLVAPGMAGATGNLYCGLHEFEEMAFLLHLLRPEDTFVDVGANVGAYTILAGAGIGCRGHALEPNPQAFDHLLDNLFLNRIVDRVQAHHAGAAAANGTLRFSAGLDTMNHVLAGETAGEPFIEVPVRRLDDLVGDSRPAAVKIDVEGYETAVIQGAQRLLGQETLRAVIMEQGGAGALYGFDEAALHAHMISDHGFQPVRYDPFSRTLQPAPAHDQSGNRIYIRNPEDVLSRVTTAPPFTVLGRAL